jgi:hypothetical protein
LTFHRIRSSNRLVNPFAVRPSLSSRHTTKF